MVEQAGKFIMLEGEEISDKSKASRTYECFESC